MNTFLNQSPVLNHIALYVFNLEKSTAFYKEVMQFQQIPEPFKDNKHSWFQIGPVTQLHIIEGETEIKDQDINGHLAFTVRDIEAFINHLDRLSVNYRNFVGDSKFPTPRPDGVKQIFFQDPDNFWIEVNDVKF